jgi:ATP-dependent RNA helicase DDX49/DBP8
MQLFSTNNAGRTRKRARSTSNTTTITSSDSSDSDGSDDEEPTATATATAAPTTTTTTSLAPTTFTTLGVVNWLVRACGALGITSPTPVQINCIPPILAGKNVLGAAQTGSGKTAAFLLPILQVLSKDPYGIFALILTPTRELAFQISQQVEEIGRAHV